ncbi:MAG: synthetase, NH3-dependent [Pseudomonadota bacterium]
MRQDYDKIENELVGFLKKEMLATGFRRAVFGLSGGIDSAVTAVLCQKAFGKNILAVMMPSDTTNPQNMSDALALCEKFNIEAEHVDLKNMLLAYPLSLDGKHLRRGNLCARLRMAILYDISSRERAIVVGTSNKSEIILGYGTHYGDTACAINPLGSLYKTQIFGLAKHLGVTNEILTKAPSADLWEGQTDEDELGHTYANLDKVMYSIFNEGKTPSELKDAGADSAIVDFVMNRYESNTFKSRLPKIAQI